MLATSWLLSSRSSERHVRRRDERRIIVENAPKTPDMTDRANGRAADFADALGDSVGHGKDLAGLLVQQQMIVPEVRSINNRLTALIRLHCCARSFCEIVHHQMRFYTSPCD
jgi:hypothetical protein